MPRRVTVLSGILPLGVLLASIALAQTDRGSITGTITDSSGAVVPNAEVFVTNTETGLKYETLTTATGNYTLGSLPAGVYSLTIKAAGFKPYTQEGIHVIVVQTARVDVALQVGSASETVTGSATAVADPVPMVML